MLNCKKLKLVQVLHKFKNEGEVSCRDAGFTMAAVRDKRVMSVNPHQMGVGNHGGAENVREALEWDSVPHMVRELKDGKEVLKMCVSDWVSTFKGLLHKFSGNLQKGWEDHRSTSTSSSF